MNIGKEYEYNIFDLSLESFNILITAMGIHNRELFVRMNYDIYNNSSCDKSPQEWMKENGKNITIEQLLDMIQKTECNYDLYEIITKDFNEIKNRSSKKRIDKYDFSDVGKLTLNDLSLSHKKELTLMMQQNDELFHSLNMVATNSLDNTKINVDAWMNIYAKSVKIYMLFSIMQHVNKDFVNRIFDTFTPLKI
jgi:hypothetical protein